MKLLPIVFPKPTIFICYLTIIAAYTGAVVWFDDHYFPRHKFLEANELMATTSIIIGLLLVFRTNSAYDRWWEGRKLWGQLVNEIRNFSIKCHSMLSREQSDSIYPLLIAFPYVLKNHLRGGKSDLAQFKIEGTDRATDQSVKNQPLYLATLVYRCLQQWKEEKAIDKLDLLFLDTHARSLMDITGACERILKSPIATSYKFIIWFWLFLYLLLLPWLLAPILDFWAVPTMVFGAYFIFALELLAEEVEEPFGTTPADLKLDSICLTIENSIKQIMNSNPT